MQIIFGWLSAITNNCRRNKRTGTSLACLVYKRYFATDGFGFKCGSCTIVYLAADEFVMLEWSGGVGNSGSAKYRSG